MGFSATSCCFTLSQGQNCEPEILKNYSIKTLQIWMQLLYAKWITSNLLKCNGSNFLSMPACNTGKQFRAFLQCSCVSCIQSKANNMIKLLFSHLETSVLGLTLVISEIMFVALMLT